MRKCGRQIPRALLAGVPVNGLDRVTNHGALLIRRHAVGVARVVNAVTKKFPMARFASLNDLRVVFAQSSRK